MGIEITNAELINKVAILIAEYQYKWHERPNYIKIPLWLWKSIQRARFTDCVVDVDECAVYLQGLKICETTSIFSLDEIEVF